MFQAPRPLSSESRINLERTIPRVGSTIFKGDIEVPTTTVGLQKYPQLARFLFQKWIHVLHSNTSQDFFPHRDETSLVEADNTLNHLHSREHNVSRGFTVTGQILGMTVAAYKKYRTTGRSIEELVSMQKNHETISRSVIWIAERPDEANSEIEEALGIYDGIYDFAIEYGDISFKVDDTTTDEPFFIPDPIRLRQLVDHELLVAEGNSCPAVYFIPKLWGEMVDIAAADPRYYESDLDLTS